MSIFIRRCINILLKQNQGNITIFNSKKYFKNIGEDYGYKSFDINNIDKKQLYNELLNVEGIKLLNINDNINNTISLLEFINKKDKVVKLNIINEDLDLLKEFERYCDFISIYIEKPPRKTGKKEWKRLNNIIEFMKDYQKDYEFMSIIIKEYYKEKDIKEIAEWLDGAKLYYFEQSKINIAKKNLTLYKTEELLEFYNILKNYVECIGIRYV